MNFAQDVVLFWITNILRKGKGYETEVERRLDGSHLMSNFAIETRDLLKDYNGFRAVSGVNFNVQRGEIFGFLGPNGAGKTTTIKMLCTLLRPTSGEAFVAGHSVLREQMSVRKSIGIVFQEPTLDDRLSASENLRFHGILYGLGGAELQKRMDEVLEMVELSERAGSFVRTFSGGMKRRLEIARGLMHTPRILFLDEPTLGLDPQTRVHIWEYLHSLKKRVELSLFLTTHYLDEAENCDRIAVIDHGKIVALDTPERLKAQVRGDMVILKTQDDSLARDFIIKEFNLKPILEEDGVHVEVTESEKWLPIFLHRLPVTVERLNLHRPTLDDVFIKLTGREIRDEEGSWLESARNFMVRRSRT